MGGTGRRFPFLRSVEHDESCLCPRLHGRPGVLLTGATGFLGGYLLKELVERTEMPIYCLTRSDGTLGARARLMDNLHFLFGADAVEAWPLERIAIVEGDLAKERFGLSEAGYAELAEHTARSSTRPPCSGISASWNSS